jgi:hypothetical protein
MAILNSRGELKISIVEGAILIGGLRFGQKDVPIPASWDFRDLGREFHFKHYRYSLRSVAKSDSISMQNGSGAAANELRTYLEEGKEEKSDWSRPL